MDVSIVIPAFNESKKIGGDVKAAVKFLTGNNLTGEIIVVDDGSSDNTAEAAKQAGANLPSSVTLNVIRYEQHRGKGHAFRTGMKGDKRRIRDVRRQRMLCALRRGPAWAGDAQKRSV